MKKPIIIILLGLLAISFCPSTLDAQEAPRLLPFQGRLTDQNGLAVNNGVRLVQFKIFDVPSSGSPVWAGELHRTTVNGGLVNVLLGSKTPFTGVDFDRQLYLEMTVDINGDNTITAADPPLLPRQAILPVVFAKQAADSRLLDGYDWSSLFAEGATNPATARIAGSRIVAQSVTAAQIAPQTITAAQIAPNTITSGQMAPGIIGGTQLANSSVATNHLTPALVEDALHPPGTVIAWMGTNNVPPAGWEFCWGQTVSRADQRYARLFRVIGTSSGNGNGSTTFQLPDFRGMFLRGVNLTRVDASRDPDANTRSSFSGGNAGNQVGSIQLDQIRSHDHETARHYLNPANQGTGPWTGGGSGGGTGATNRITAFGGAETRPKNVYVQYLIKL